MRLHPLVLGTRSFVTLAFVALAFVALALVAVVSRADVLGGPPAAHAVTPEEVLVAAPEPRYAAPTLRDRIGRVWAPVYINGHGPFRLVLDTGANSTAITRAVAMQVGAPILASTMRVLGVTGSSLVPSIRVNSIEVGDLWLDSRHIAIVEDVFGGAEGVLGANGLSDKRVFIDFSNDEIAIQYSRRKTRPAGFARIPVRVRDGHLLMFEVWVAGVRTKAMLDTGAQSTIGNESLRKALARWSQRGATNSIVGVTLDVQEGQTFAAPPVSIGKVTVRGMRVTFADFHIFNAWNMDHQPALLIGMDVIGLLDALIIDYKHQELYLRVRE
jgi:predicted aspartyl protease